MMKRLIALVLSSALAAPACATSGATTTLKPPTEQQMAQRAVFAEYVQRLPPGSSIRVERATGRTVRGTLLKATDRSMFVQPRTRIPEPAVEVPLDEVLSVTLETRNGTSVARAIGVGAAAGAGAALAVILVLIAAYSD